MSQVDQFLTGLSVGLGVWLVSFVSHRCWCLFKSFMNG